MKRPLKFSFALGGSAALAVVAFGAWALDLAAPLEVPELPLPAPVAAPLSAEGACAPDNNGWPAFQPFVGALHEHSGYSDGAPGSIPADYFAQIRARGFAFAGASEHSDNARIPITANEACLPLDTESCAEAMEACAGDQAECAEITAACVRHDACTRAVGECTEGDDECAEQVAECGRQATLCVEVTPADPDEGVTKWEETQRQAEVASDESFTAFRGFEWTSDRFGHINVYFSKNDTNAKADGGHAAMESFWTWFMTRPELGGGADGLAAFNHPGREDAFTTADPGFNWNDFVFVPAADLRMVGIEVFNRRTDFGTRNDNVPPGSPGWYAHALDRGWHLGPIGAEDEHDEDWGTGRRGKTVLIARDLSAPALREALFARRFYAVGPDHNDLRVAYALDGQPMGARLARPAGAKLRLKAEVVAGAFNGSLELVTNGGQVVARTGGAALNRWVRVAEGGERWYFVRALDKAGNPIAYSAPIWVRAGGAYPLCGEWLAGDLHVHTTYSHDSWGGPETPEQVPAPIPGIIPGDSIEVPAPVRDVITGIIPGDDNTGPDEFFTLGHTVERQFRIAAARGLDYLAITDHNDIRSQDDDGFGAHGVIPIPSYENSLSGHAQMHGARRCYSSNLNGNAICNEPGESNPPLQTLADALRVDDGVFQVNHPAGESTNWPRDADWGEARTDADQVDYTDDVVPDTVEIWNIAWAWQPPAPSGNALDDAVRYWEGWLDLGHKVGATGGSDNHFLATTAVQGNGQPTTWVFATERSERGVLDGLRRGHTYITHQPPLLNSPRVLLEADADGDNLFEASVGDTVPASSSLRVRVANAPGALLRIVSNGGVQVLGPVPVVSPEFEFGFTLPVGATWVRAELVEPDGAAERATVCDEPLGGETTYCRNRLAVLAMTSALYLQQ